MKYPNKYSGNCLFVMAFMYTFSNGVFVSKSLASAVQYSGTVVDQKGQPISKAIVRLQGTTLQAFTNQTGNFRIIAEKRVSSKHITAWKDGYFNGGYPLPPEGLVSTIRLAPILNEDNRIYEWLPALFQTIKSDKSEVKPCQKCHPDLTEQWIKSTHASSATNPVFLAFFQGTDNAGERDVGPGYKLDFPNSNGNCSSCHIPVMAQNKPFNSNPNEAKGVAREGVSCDFCHKINSVKIDDSGGYPGGMSYKFNRPSGEHQLFYGPYDDVFPGDDSYHPLYKDSRYCAPCHNGKFWDVMMYSEYEEWTKSDYATRNISCQNCHMAPDGVMTRFALEKEGGIERKPETIPSHTFNGIQDLNFMKESIELDVLAEQKDNHLTVTATVKNTKAGHHYPTGNPMRNMILLLDVTGENDLTLPLVSGEKVPVWGGVGNIEDGNFAGFPGKGFAKVLRDSSPYPDGRGQKHFKPQYPAPHWRPSVIESDSRIPANGMDVSQYEFSLPADLRGPIQVKVRLIFRRAYKNWMDTKGFKEQDMELAQKKVTVGR
jgi:hypothetical protein